MLWGTHWDKMGWSPLCHRFDCLSWRGCMSPDTNLHCLFLCIIILIFIVFFLYGWVFQCQSHRFPPAAAAVTVTSSHRHSQQLGLLLHSGWLVKRLSFILFVIWVSGSARVCFSKPKGIRPEITVKSMFIYKSDFVECNRNTPLNIITAWIFFFSGWLERSSIVTGGSMCWSETSLKLRLYRHLSEHLLYSWPPAQLNKGWHCADAVPDDI